MGALATLRRHAADPVYANGYALVANAALSALLGFAFWLVAARRFPADALGVGAAVVSAATLAALVGKAGFDAAVIRFAPSSSARGLRRLLLVSALSTVALTLVVATVLLAFAAFGIESLRILLQPLWTAGFLLLAAGIGVAWILDAYFVSEQRAWLVLARNVAFNGVKLVVPLVLVVAWAGRAVPLAWAVGLAASLVVAFAALPSRLRAHEPHAPQPLERKRVLGYAMRNYANNLSEFLPGLLLPILVLDALGPEANARFFLAWTVATVGFLASKAIAQSAFAALVRDPRPHAAVRKALLLGAALLGPGIAVLYFAPGLVLGLFGEDYGAEGATLLRLLALSVAPLAIANVFLALLKARDAGWELTLVPAGALAAMLVAMPLALHAWGVDGVGLVWLVVQTAAGAYASVRLIVLLGRPQLSPSRRFPHEG